MAEPDPGSPPVARTVEITQRRSVESVGASSTSSCEPYFWNAAGRFADEAAQTFEALGAAAYTTVQRSAIRAYVDHAHDLRRYRDGGTTEAFSASCKLKVFDEVDEAFMGIYARVTVTDILTAWLRSRLRKVADAIGVTG